MTDEPVLKSSGEWSNEKNIFVVDPDGWDRRNLEISWAEPISEDEYNKRMMISTVYSIDTSPAPAGPAPDVIYSDLPEVEEDTPNAN